MALLEIGFISLGVALGAAIGWLLASNRFSSEIIDLKARSEAKESMDVAIKEREEAMAAQMEVIANRVTQSNSENFLTLAEERMSKVALESEKDHDARKKEVEGLVTPLKEQMDRLVKMNNEIEEKRAGAYEGIKRHLKELGDQTQSLSTRTIALSTALTTSGQARGNWGEVKLRRLFEMAGLSEHVDFFEQVTLEDGSRPDFVVRLPQEGVIPIDSKASGSHFLQAAELEPGPEQQELLAKHSQAVKQRIKELSAKAYQDSIEGEFDHVIMFIPSEAMAAAAFSTDPELMEYALSKFVLVATPVTMLGLLRTVALYWQQHALAEGSKEIYDTSRELYKRTTTMMDHFNRLGGHLSNAAKSYNETMRSYETRVLPQGRRLDELKVPDTLQKTLPDPKEIQHTPRTNTKESNEQE